MAAPCPAADRPRFPTADAERTGRRDHLCALAAAGGPGTFERHLDEVVDLVVPHRMSLSDDPYEVHGRWLAKRVDDIAGRIVYRLTTAWLAQALDREAPNTDRWWLAVGLLNGLAQSAYGQAVHEGYHLLESIALAQRPGTWHTQPDVGPQHMGWNPHAVVPRTTEVEATPPAPKPQRGS